MLGQKPCCRACWNSRRLSIFETRPTRCCRTHRHGCSAPSFQITLSETFLDAGGPVLWFILALSIILWSLIIERYWYFYRIHPGLLSTSRKVFQDIQLPRWHKSHIRDAMISQISLNLTRSLPQIRTLIMLCPLFGLLGTVTGMIQVFDVVALTGTGNAKAMASGISMATIPTMAGLVTASEIMGLEETWDRVRNCH